MADIASILRDGQDVDMPALRAHLAQSDAVLATGTIAALVGPRVYATRAALYADLVPAAAAYALVTFDSDGVKNGLYVKVGATGTGSWTGPSDLYASAAEAAVQPLLDQATAAIAAATTVPTVIAGPLDPTATGTTFLTPATYFWPTSLKNYDQFLSKVEIGVSAASVAQIVVANVEGDGTLTLISAAQISLAAGARLVDGLSIPVPAGAVVGLRFVSGGGYYSPTTIPGGQSSWSTAGLPGSHTTKAVAVTNGVRWRGTLVPEVPGKARSAFASINDLRGQFGIEQHLGWPTIVATGTNVPTGYTIIPQAPATVDGIVTGAVIGAGASGPARLMVVTVDPGTLAATIVSFVDVVLQAGINTLALAMPIAAGQYVAISGSTYRFQNASNPEAIPVWFKSSALVSGDVVTFSIQHRYEVAWTIKSGLLAASASGTAAAAGSGLGLLDAADPAGIIDATAVFLAAKGSHPYPYVRPGTFALTSIPADGGGFWGPGKPIVAGERFFIPFRPASGNLYDELRAAMLEHMAAGDVLTLISDSIGHFAYSGTGPAHWFNRLTRFVNLGIAADEPAMTALRPSSTYLPSFYGVTTSGTVSTGTAGPLGESIVLAAGAAITFSGAYEQVDVFYTRQSGAGSLSLAYNGGSAFKIVNAAGATDLDRYSGPSPTGQSAAGIYTITASGGPVEITGLIRLGVKTGNSPPRLRMLRAAHGSYSFTSFGAAPVASILKQASYAGGVCVPILALGINDSFGTAPASIIANATALIDALQAGGAPRIYAVPPARPTSVWNASYTGGRTYDAAIGPLRRLYRQRGVNVIPLDRLDWAGEGLMQDGLHPNIDGNDRYAQIVIEALARA